MTSDPLSGELTPNGHVLRQRVYFEDTDFSGLVYHARYLQFMERGRSEFLRTLGIRHSALSEQGLAFAVRRMTIEFDRPARIDDVLTITTKPKHCGGARLILDQSVAREHTLLVRAEVTVALVGPGGKAARLPAEIQALVRGALSPET